MVYNSQNRNSICFRFQARKGKTHTLLGPLEKAKLNQGPNRVGVSLPSPEDGNRFSFRYVVFLLFEIPDDGQSPDIVLTMI
jgi:hypothetical protein